MRPSMFIDGGFFVNSETVVVVLHLYTRDKCKSCDSYPYLHDCSIRVYSASHTGRVSAVLVTTVCVYVKAFVHEVRMLLKINPRNTVTADGKSLPDKIKRRNISIVFGAFGAVTASSLQSIFSWKQFMKITSQWTTIFMQQLSVVWRVATARALLGVLRNICYS